MDQGLLQASLARLDLGAIRYFDRLGSTNDEAACWAEQGAPDLALVVANEQTAGRGRDGRAWYSQAGVSLAFSLVLYPAEKSAYILPRLTALGAIAVKEALQNRYGLPAQVKWPNDVLVHRQKLAGVLAEAVWSGEHLSALVMGAGINVAPDSVSTAYRREAELHFPATCVETVLGRPVDRWELLAAVLAELIRWRPKIASQDFLYTWEASLAFRGEWVQITVGQGAGKDGLPHVLESQPPAILEGKVLGLAQDGSLKLRTHSGEVITVQFGEVRLRPTEPSAALD